MAKVGFWLRGAKGKLAGSVLSKGANGQTIARELVTPKNPKTAKQMAQRAIFATAQQAYSALQEICNHSYEGVQYGAKSQQVFIKDAISMLRGRASQDEGQFLIPGVSTIMANPFLISKGSVASVRNFNWDGDATNLVFNLNNMTNPMVGGNSYVSAKSFCDALGINKGDQVTFVAITDDGGNEIGAYENLAYYRNHVNIARITVKADAEDDEIVYDTNEETIGSAVIVENLGTSDDSNAKFYIDAAGENTMNFGVRNTEKLLALAVIRSVKDGDTWKRSTERLQCATDDIMLYEFNDVLPAWLAGTTQLVLESDRYLNNAEQEAVTASYSVESVSVFAQNATTSSYSLQTLAVVQKNLGGELSNSPIVDDNNFGYTVNNSGHLVKSTTYKVNSVNAITLAQAQRLVPSIVVDIA